MVVKVLDDLHFKGSSEFQKSSQLWWKKSGTLESSSPALQPSPPLPTAEPDSPIRARPGRGAVRREGGDRSHGQRPGRGRHGEGSDHGPGAAASSVIQTWGLGWGGGETKRETCLMSMPKDVQAGMVRHLGLSGLNSLESIPKLSTLSWTVHVLVQSWRWKPWFYLEIFWNMIWYC